MFVVLLVRAVKYPLLDDFYIEDLMMLIFFFLDVPHCIVMLALCISSSTTSRKIYFVSFILFHSKILQTQTYVTGDCVKKKHFILSFTDPQKISSVRKRLGCLFHHQANYRARNSLNEFQFDLFDISLLLFNCEKRKTTRLFCSCFIRQLIISTTDYNNDDDHLVIKIMINFSEIVSAPARLVLFERIIIACSVLLLLFECC